MGKEDKYLKLSILGFMLMFFTTDDKFLSIVGFRAISRFIYIFYKEYTTPIAFFGMIIEIISAIVSLVGLIIFIYSIIKMILNLKKSW